ncbi:MAG TPA: type II secretion system F family protein [Bradyrhizobium sp.]|nr:type II secretion system F family protein [Bradyrhizobium sp.]
MADSTPLIVALLAFCATGGLAFVVGQYYLRAAHLDRRLPALQEAAGDRGSASGIAAMVARHFDEKRFGVDDTVRGQLRLNLVRAGYFRKDAVNFYVFWRLVAAALLPLLGYVLIGFFANNAPIGIKLVFVAAAAALGIIGPDGFVSRRQRLLTTEYRTIFPDFLDLLVVCVDAGLSLEGAIDRITSEISARSKFFGINLAVMGAEMRAGRTFVEALGTLADRLMIPEARALLAILRQSSELGSDVGEALRVFGDEMREKRMLRAEEQANKLSVKMLIPMTLCIFPLVLMVIALPLVVRMLGSIGLIW